MNNETISLNGLDDSPLKTSLGQLVTHIYNLEEQVQHYKNEVEEHEAHSDQLETDVETLLAENEKLKKENEDLNRRFNDVNCVPTNPNYTEKAILEFIGSCPVKVVEKINQKQIEDLKKENEAVKHVLESEWMSLLKNQSKDSS